MNDWLEAFRPDPGSRQPLYYQLREFLRRRIEFLGPDVRLPPEHELSVAFSVSRATLRRAVAELVQDGLLTTRQGLGTFTAPRWVESTLGGRPLGFTESTTKAGLSPSTRVMSVHVTPASPTVAYHLQIVEDAPVVVMERLRLMDDVPAMVERAHLSAELFPGLADLDLGGSLYSLLAERYQLEPARGVETVMAINADQRLAQLLEVPIATALLATARRSMTDHGVPIEYTLRHARGDRCSFYIEYHGDTGLIHQATAAEMFDIPAGSRRGARRPKDAATGGGLR